MKALKCEMCGSNDVVKQDGLYVCQNCGTKYTVEEARKMMVEGTVSVEGTVKIDSSSELQNLYKLARIASSENNTENAAKYYEQILVKDPNNWEPNYYAIYYKSMNCKIAEISRAAKNVARCLLNVLVLVKKIQDSEQQGKVVEEIFARNNAISQMFFNAAKNHYENLDQSIQDKFLDDYLDNIAKTTQIMVFYGMNLEGLFDEKYMYVAVESWKSAINIHKEKIKYLTPKSQEEQVKIMEDFAEKIRKYDSTYELPEIDYGSNDSGNSGCYVATAVYGSYNCPEVWTLRRFRDNTLDATWYGRAFIKTYYAISPTLVKWFGETDWFKKMWKTPLDKMVSSLRKKGIASTPYHDKY